MTIGKIAKALSIVQGNIDNAKKDKTNPFFKSKYADLSSVWAACRDQLSANEIAVVQAPCVQDGIFGLNTQLIHSSGEFIESFMPVAAPITAKAQEMGSAITYARRYSLSSMVGVAPDEDDDGNAANTTQPSRLTPKEKTMKEKSVEFAEKVDASKTVEELDKVVKDNVLLTGKMLTERPAWYSSLIEKIEAKRKELG